MTRTYLVRIRLNIAVASAFGHATGSSAPIYDEYDVLSLLPADCLLISTAGDTILFARRTNEGAKETLATVQSMFSEFTVDGASVLEVGPRCHSTDDDGCSALSSDHWDEVPLHRWLDGDAGNRPTHGCKVIILETLSRNPKDVGSILSLLRRLPGTKTHWTGRNSLMVAVSWDHPVAHLWGHPAVQRAANDPELTLVACLEAGPSEASMHSLELVLPSCARSLAPVRPKSAPKTLRPVVVEYRHRRAKGGTSGEVGSAGACKRAETPSGVASMKGASGAPRPANDHSANDNRRTTVIHVERSGRRRPR